MTYALDTDGTRQVGATLLTSGDELHECGTAIAYAGGLALRGVASAHLGLTTALSEFVEAHLQVVEVLASGCAGLGGRLTWAAQSGHEVELATAAELGAAGRPRP